MHYLLIHLTTFFKCFCNTNICSHYLFLLKYINLSMKIAIDARMAIQTVDLHTLPCGGWMCVFTQGLSQVL